jgi:ABC-type sugar transport system substrate-binding protein
LTRIECSVQINRRRLIAIAVSAATTPVSIRLSAAQEATPAASPIPVQKLLDTSAPETGPVRAARSYRLRLLVPFKDDPFWQSVQNAVAGRATADGVTVDIVPLSAPSVPEQLSQIDDAITNQVDGILLGPIDAAAIAPGIASANAAGIPVIAIDTAPTAGQVVSVVRTDNVAAARRAGLYIGQKLAGKGSVLNVQGDLANPVGQERDTGFRDGLSGFPDITLVSAPGSWQYNNGLFQTLAQLPQPQKGTPTPPEPLVNAVFAAGPEMARGAADAVEQVQADTVFVVGFGATNDTLRMIRNGLLDAVVAEYPTRAGAMAVDQMVRHLNGESIPMQLDSGSTLVNGGNIDAFVASGAQ